MSKNSNTSKREGWSSNIGVIMAVAGTAVGLGNFLRFPGQAAQFGGGAFMIAYFISLLVLGLPLGWMEWTMGRYAGRRGYSSYPGVLNLIWKNPIAKYVGVFGVVTLIVLYTYYAFVEAWCLGYAVNFLKGTMHFETIDEAASFFGNFVGAHKDGANFNLSFNTVGPFLLAVLVLNISIIYRGVSKGIELFAKYAVPTLVVIAIVILIRVLTLGAPDSNNPENNINNGLGFMWNPTKVYLQEFNAKDGSWSNGAELVGKQNLKAAHDIAAKEPARFRVNEVTVSKQLKNPRLWLAAASQVFFSLAIGFGVVMVYASYTKDDDDLVLSNLTAVSANEFCEVCLGGLITLPAAFAFFGAAGIVGQGIFDLGFKVLPMVFSQMGVTQILGVNVPLGNIFGFLFFFLLFTASISGVLAQLQCGIAFIEEAMNVGRKRAVAIVALIASLGFFFVAWFSHGIKAMDTLDFWIGNFLIFTLSMINVVIYGWVFGLDKAFEEAHKGAAIKIPSVFKFISKYVCPLFLISIFILWLLFNVLGVGGYGIDSHILDLVGTKDTPPNTVAWLSVGLILTLVFFLSLIAARAPRYKRDL